MLIYKNINIESSKYIDKKTLFIRDFFYGSNDEKTYFLCITLVYRAAFRLHKNEYEKLEAACRYDNRYD